MIEYWGGDPLKSAFETWAAIATIFAVVVGFFSLIVAWAQIRAARLLQREDFANQIYAEQLRLDLEYPHFALPNYDEIIESGKLEQYMTFVSHLLWAIEEILRVTDDEDWKYIFKEYLAYHHRHLSRDGFDCGKKYYTQKVVDVIKYSINNYEELLEPPALKQLENFERDYKNKRLAQAKSELGKAANG